MHQDSHLFSLPDSVQLNITDKLSEHSIKTLRASNTHGQALAGLAITKLSVTDSQLSSSNSSHHNVHLRFPHVRQLCLTNCSNTTTEWLSMNTTFVEQLEVLLLNAKQYSTLGLMGVLGNSATRLRNLVLDVPSSVMRELEHINNAVELKSLHLTLHGYPAESELAQIGLLSHLQSLHLHVDLRGDVSSLRAVMHLQSLTRLVIIATGIKSDTKSTFAQALAQLTQLEHLTLDLDHVQAHDNNHPAVPSRMSIAWLSSLTQLTELTLAGTYCLGRRPADLPVEGFTSLHRLRRLALHQCGIAMRGNPLMAVEDLPLGSFTGLSTLSRLEFSWATLSGSSLAALADMPGLVQLDTACCHEFGKLEVEQILPLLNLSKLRIASYCGQPLDPRKFASLPTLTDFEVTNSRIAGWGWAADAGQLTRLHVEARSYAPFLGWPMTTDVQGLQQLRQLHASCLVPEDALQALSCLPWLESVSGVMLDRITQPLTGFPQLTRLAFQPHKTFDGNSVSMLVPVLRRLRCLQLLNEALPAAEFLAALAQCRRLVSFRTVENFSVAVCAVLAQLPDLVELDLWMGWWPLDALRAALGLPHLRRLHLDTNLMLVHGREAVEREVRGSCPPGLVCKMGTWSADGCTFQEAVGKLAC